MDAPAKPAPRLSKINRPFFAACNEDRFILQQCELPDCGRFVYFPRVCCPHCGGGDLAWRPVSGRGRIRTFTIIRRPQHPGFFPEAPYWFAAVELAEGPLMYSRIEGRPDPDANLIGRDVQAVFVPLTPNQKLPHFVLT